MFKVLRGLEADHYWHPFLSVFWLGKKEKVKCTLVPALRLCTGRTVHRGSKDITLLFLDHGTRRGEGSASRLGRSLYRRLGGPQGRSGRVRKISLPPGFDPRAVQPVASRYIDWATRPTLAWWPVLNSYLLFVKAIPLQVWTGPECSRSLRLPDLKTVGTWRW